MGSHDTATRRLNLAQAFNPIGSLAGMFVAMKFIQAKLNPLSTEERALLDPEQFDAVKNADLAVLSRPYVIIGAVLVVFFVVIMLLVKTQAKAEESHDQKFGPTVHRLWQNKPYRYGVVAQFFYVGVQIMCWTFIIQYGTRIFMNEGMTEQTAEILSQRYNIVAMAIFCVSRFICTFLLKYINPSKLLTILGITGAALVLGVIFFDGRAGMYCLVAVSACMSLMFPTIYGIALTDTGDDAKLGAAGLIMAILGGSVLPPLQARIIDGNGLGNIPSVNLSFILPLICFVVIVIYGSFITKIEKNETLLPNS
jgi:FHS family L-fucose permease-like MFS transporter